MSQPNVLLITLDAVRPDALGCYGGPAPTRNIDRLASAGVRFDQAISVYGYTPVSVYSILTGAPPPVHGCVMLSDTHIEPPSSDVPGIQHALREMGYRTGAVTSLSLLDAELGFTWGFDAFHRVEYGSKVNTPDLGDRVNAVATQWLDDTDGRPWFLWVHYFDAHSPYSLMPEYHNAYANRPYIGAIAYVDTCIGRLLERVNLEETIVVVVSDHGESFGEHGVFFHGNFYDETLRVPLLIAGPGVSACTVRQLVRTIDVAPTLLDCLGCEPSRSLIRDDRCGVTLLPAVRDASADLELEAYCGLMTAHGHVYAALRNDRYKFIADTVSPIRRRGVRPGSLRDRIQAALGRTTNASDTPYVINGRSARLFLFDLELDPHERMNLLGELPIYLESPVKIEHEFPTLDMPSYRQMAKSMRNRLMTYLEPNAVQDSRSLSRRDRKAVTERLRALGYV